MQGIQGCQIIFQFLKAKFYLRNMKLGDQVLAVKKTSTNY